MAFFLDAKGEDQAPGNLGGVSVYYSWISGPETQQISIIAGPTQQLPPSILWVSKHTWVSEIQSSVMLVEIYINMDRRGKEMTIHIISAMNIISH